MLRVDTSPRKKNRPRPAWKVTEAYRQWLRGRKCAFHSIFCDGRIEAAHTPSPRSKGMSTKAADFNCIPACQHHHKLQTDRGWSAVGMTREGAEKMAETYWRNWPGRKAWETKNEQR